MTATYEVTPSALHQDASATEDVASSFRSASRSATVSPGNPQFPFSARVSATVSHFGNQQFTLAGNLSDTGAAMHSVAQAHASMEGRNVQAAQTIGRAVQ